MILGALPSGPKKSSKREQNPNFPSDSDRLCLKLIFQAIKIPLHLVVKMQRKLGLGFDWKKTANFSQNGLKLVCITKKHCNIETFVSVGASSIHIGPIFKG